MTISIRPIPLCLSLPTIDRQAGLRVRIRYLNLAARCRVIQRYRASVIRYQLIAGHVSAGLFHTVRRVKRQACQRIAAVGHVAVLERCIGVFTRLHRERRVRRYFVVAYQACRSLLDRQAGLRSVSSA